MPSHNELDAVTVDAFGTIVELCDPVEPLAQVLAARGVERDHAAIERAFAAEAEYYVRHSLRGRDEASLEALRRDCAEVFLHGVHANLDPGEFAPDYVAALEFRVIEGTIETLDSLRSAGLRLACVGNWDRSLESVLERLGVAGRFEAIVSSAVAGVEKPDPAIFLLALDRLGAAPDRALHIGDRDIDREGASAAGLRFEPVPLATLPARLGL
jgi:HAD superfamily hydrolase (TIGR01549 family)